MRFSYFLFRLMKVKILLSVAAVVVLGIWFLTGFNQGKEPQNILVTTNDMSTFSLTSDAFKHNGKIPDRFTCEGEDLNPPMEIRQAPAGTVSFTLIVDDPDAPRGNWNHWLVWNIPVSQTRIEEGSLPRGAVLGMNDFGRTSYGGPCPPAGPTHRYFFKLYALDAFLDLKEGATKEQLENALTGHVLGEAELIGLYQR